MKHDFRTIQTHIKLVIQRKLKEREWIEIAYSPNGVRSINKAVWINSKQHLEKLKELGNCNLSVGNSLRIGKSRKEGPEARASRQDCGGKLVQIFDIENEEEHKTTREQGKFIPKDTVKEYINIFLNNIKPIYNGKPLYTAYTGGGGQVGIRLSREIPPHIQKQFGDALKLVLGSHGALIEKDDKTGETINPIGADPSRFDVAGLQRLIGSYNHERKVQTTFLEINRNSKSLHVYKIFEKAKEIQAQNDKKTVKKIIASNPNYEKWNEFIDQDLIPRITFSQLLLDQGWIGQDKGQYWLFNCNLHPPDNHPSFTVWNDIAGAKDYHTDRGYNPISLIMEIKNLNFKEALQYLADYVGIDCPDFDPPIANKRNSRKKKDKDHSCVWGGHFRDTLRNYLNSGGDLYIKSNVTFQDVVNEAKKFLYVTSDTEYAFKLALASTVGNYFDDDPTWLLVVAPPSSAKTEIIISIGGSPFAWNISSFTSKTLASGDKNSKNASLLSRIGGFGLIFLKDLTTILELHPTERGEIFSQLREIYDGRFFKTFGNGVEIDWRGKIGVIGACTPIIEKYGEIFKVLGERFLICRINDISEENEDLAIDKALSDQSDSIHSARDRLQNSVDEFLKDCLYDALNEKIELSDENLNMIKVCSKFISYTRAIVVRDSYNRDEILVKPFKESSMRLAKQLKSLVKGLCLIDNVDIPTNDHINILFRVALDNIPSIKREIIETVPEEGIYATDLARKLGYSEESRYFRRIIEDLSMLRILERKKESNRVSIYQSEVIRDFYIQCNNLTAIDSKEEDSDKTTAKGEKSKAEEKHNLSTEQTKIDQIRDTPYGPEFKIETLDKDGKPIIQIITSESDNYEEIKKLYEEQNRS